LMSEEFVRKKIMNNYQSIILCKLNYISQYQMLCARSWTSCSCLFGRDGM